MKMLFLMMKTNTWATHDLKKNRKLKNKIAEAYKFDEETF